MTAVRTRPLRSSIPSNYGLIRFCAATSGLHAVLTVLVHIPHLAADEGFVDLDFAAQLAAGLLILHGQASTL